MALICMADETKKTTGWEHFPHRADVGIRGFGQTKNQAFEQAAIALTAVITDPADVQPDETIQINCQADNDELIFVDWLNGIIYEMDIRKMLFSRFEVHLEQNTLNATAWGQQIDIKKHQPTVEVKGASYTALSVRQENGTWTAQCIVDV